MRYIGLLNTVTHESCERSYPLRNKKSPPVYLYLNIL